MKIFHIISLVLEKDDMVLESKFTEYGVDSTTFVKIVVAIEDALNIEFDDSKLLLTALPTIKSVIEYAEEKCDCANIFDATN